MRNQNHNFFYIMSDHCKILWVIRPNHYLNLGNGSKTFGNHCINTFPPRLIQAVCTKKAGSHMALHGNFSSPVSAADPVKSSKVL